MYIITFVDKDSTKIISFVPNTKTIYVWIKFMNQVSQFVDNLKILTDWHGIHKMASVVTIIIYLYEAI